MHAGPSLAFGELWTCSDGEREKSPAVHVCGLFCVSGALGQSANGRAGPKPPVRPRGRAMMPRVPEVLPVSSALRPGHRPTPHPEWVEPQDPVARVVTGSLALGSDRLGIFPVGVDSGWRSHRNSTHGLILKVATASSRQLLQPRTLNPSPMFQPSSVRSIWPFVATSQ